MSKTVGPYTPVVRAGDLLFVSGQIGIVDGSTVDGPSPAASLRAVSKPRPLRRWPT